MSYADFELAIWHPFGPHGRETAEEILQRKRREIEGNGWTLWSFQHRRIEVLEEWSRLLSTVKSPLVFCSNSPGAIDPAERGAPVGVRYCRSYRPACQRDWKAIPGTVKVPHPMRARNRDPSAFMVQRIVYPTERLPSVAVEWFSKGQWQVKPLPTRGEYLIRRGGLEGLRAVRAILELRPPSLATVSAQPVP
jgi:hypothetical protein